MTDEERQAWELRKEEKRLRGNAEHEIRMAVCGGDM